VTHGVRHAIADGTAWILVMGATGSIGGPDRLRRKY
jgi:hypothetical protein